MKQTNRACLQDLESLKSLLLRQQKGNPIRDCLFAFAGDLNASAGGAYEGNVSPTVCWFFSSVTTRSTWLYNNQVIFFVKQLTRPPPSGRRSEQKRVTKQGELRRRRRKATMFWRCNAALVRLDRKKFNQRESLLLPKHEAISFEIALFAFAEDFTRILHRRGSRFYT